MENYQSNWCLLLLQVEICYQNVFRELFANCETEWFVISPAGVLSSCTRPQEPIQKTKQYTTANQRKNNGYSLVNHFVSRASSLASQAGEGALGTRLGTPCTRTEPCWGQEPITDGPFLESPETCQAH